MSPATKNRHSEALQSQRENLGEKKTLYRPLNFRFCSRLLSVCLCILFPAQDSFCPVPPTKATVVYLRTVLS